MNDNKGRKRRSGVLLHISSLPGEYGCGSFGKEALEFCDLLYKCGFTVWQTLPFCRTDFCYSPYKSCSAFSSNPYFIDLTELYERGLLTKEELDQAKQQTPYSCEFERLERERLPLLARAASRTSDSERKKIELYLQSFPMAKALSDYLARKDAEKAEDKDRAYKEAYLTHSFCEYTFDRQWQKVKAYANSLGIKIIGDMPFYVDNGSLDTELYPQLFKLDAKGNATDVAGVPPDAFSDEGQLWGNPLYDWDKMAEDGFEWWKMRTRHNFRYFDILRIDHFRAIEAYWSVGADAKTAKNGKWIKGPGMPFVDALKEAAGDNEIIAEDLGEETPSLRKFLDETELAGMRVFQFADISGSPYDRNAPINYVRKTVAYTGTHDNNTLLGRMWEIAPEHRQSFFDAAGYEGQDISRGCKALMSYLLGSIADTVVLPIQDLLLYGCDTRMNTPGVALGNWSFRVTKDALSKIDIEFFRRRNIIFGRF